LNLAAVELTRFLLRFIAKTTILYEGSKLNVFSRFRNEIFCLLSVGIFIMSLLIQIFITVIDRTATTIIRKVLDEDLYFAREKFNWGSLCPNQRAGADQ